MRPCASRFLTPSSLEAASEPPDSLRPRPDALPPATRGGRPLRRSRPPLPGTLRPRSDPRRPNTDSGLPLRGSRSPLPGTLRLLFDSLPTSLRPIATQYRWRSPASRHGGAASPHARSACRAGTSSPGLISTRYAKRRAPAPTATTRSNLGPGCRRHDFARCAAYLPPRSSTRSRCSRSRPRRRRRWGRQRERLRRPRVVRRQQRRPRRTAWRRRRTVRRARSGEVT